MVVLLSHLRPTRPRGPGPRIHIPSNRVAQLNPPDTAPCRLPRLAGLWWRYSNPPPHHLRDVIVRTIQVDSHHHLRSVRRLLVTANVVPSSPILVTLMMEALRSTKTSALTRATQRNIPENTILHRHRRENLNSYIALSVWAS
jgi:hypothetical protein